MKKINSRNPVVNEIIAPRRMDGLKLARLNYNKPGKAVGWLSESRGNASQSYTDRSGEKGQRRHGKE